MKEVEFLRRLADRARREPVPDVDVVSSVLAQLRSREEDVNRPLAWIAGLASLAALPALLMGILALEPLMDPLLGVFWVFRWTML